MVMEGHVTQCNSVANLCVFNSFWMERYGQHTLTPNSSNTATWSVPLGIGDGPTGYPSCEVSVTA